MDDRFWKAFGCRPHDGDAAYAGPASANLQGRKPREVWRGGAPDSGLREQFAIGYVIQLMQDIDQSFDAVLSLA